MKYSKRRLSLIIGVIAIAFILYLFLLKPTNNQTSSGSSYNYSPDGYAGWYQYMSDKGTTIKRWQKPSEELVKATSKVPITLLRVYGNWQAVGYSQADKQWLDKGNRLVILGFRTSSTNAPFTTLISQDSSSIKIETTRRETVKYNNNIILKDDFGAIVWSENLSKEKVIFSSTPYLAANAYPKPLINYEFLAGLVQPSPNYEVWIDEYIHGYKDPQTRLKETAKDIFQYLQNTPLYPVFIQVTILLCILIIGLNIRLGKSKSLPSIKVNNSQAYIMALGDVLEKAESRYFVIETIMKKEQSKLQKALGLGEVLLDKNIIYQAWQEQTQHSSKEIQQVLEITKDLGSLNDGDVIAWLKRWQSIHAIVTK